MQKRMLRIKNLWIELEKYEAKARRKMALGEGAFGA
jgi:hypothetical protein